MLSRPHPTAQPAFADAVGMVSTPDFHRDLDTSLTE